MIWLRSALFNVVFFTISVGLTLVASLVRLVAPDLVLRMAMLWGRMIIAAMRIICGIRLEVRGLEHIPTGAALIASRHQSAFDTFVWLTLVPRCCYVFKQELRQIPLFGPLIDAAGMIAINREGGGGAVRTLLRATDRAVQEGRQIIIFPEGTRSEPGSPVALQAGVAAIALRTGLPVVPVSTDSGRYWGRRAFRKRPGTIRILVGPPIDPQVHRSVLMGRLREALGVFDREV